MIGTFIVVNTAPSLIISTVYKVIGTYHIEPWDEQIALERLVYKNSGLTQEHMLINNLGSGGLLYGLNDKMTYYTPRQKTSS